MKKRITALAMALSLVGALAACSTDDNPNGTNSGTSAGQVARRYSGQTIYNGRSYYDDGRYAADTNGQVYGGDRNTVSRDLTNGARDIVRGAGDAIEDVGFLASIPLWLVSLLGSLFITVMSFILILTVYGRFFRLYFYTALAPLPLASFAGEGTSFAGTAFLKSYVGVCLEGAIIVLACLIFSAFMSSGTPVVDTSLSAVTMSWQYIGETIFNMMVLVGLVKGAERIVKEMFGL